MLVHGFGYVLCVQKPACVDLVQSPKYKLDEQYIQAGVVHQCSRRQ